MLLNFTVSNFTSFGLPTTFSMEAGHARGKRDHLAISRGSRTLKFASIYGSNAAGKSNFVKAMNFARNVVINEGKIPSGYTSSYNRANSENANIPSTFEFELLLGRKRFVYGFSLILSTLTFMNEWLYESANERIPIFIRSFDNAQLLNLPVKGDAEKRLRIYFDDIKEDQETLFLREMNRKKDEIYKEVKSIIFLREIYNWFAQQLVFIYPQEGDGSRYSFTFNTDKETLFSTLRIFGIDITDYKYEPTSIDKVLGLIPEDLKKNIQSDIEQVLATNRRDDGDIKNNAMLFNGKDLCSFELNSDGALSVQVVKMQHGSLGEYLLSEESDGTRRILELVEILLSEKEDVTYIVDEIDRSMHPLLTDAFISEYLAQVSQKNIQLVITTHESRLLNTNRLRRDEIWFAAKKSGTTDIWRLDQMEDTENTGALARGDIKIEAAYLNGRYGAVPTLLSCIDGECQ